MGFGISVPRKVFSKQSEILIPPLSWYQNLGGTGEFWHPRTIVGFLQKEKVYRIEGMALNGQNIEGMRGFIRQISAQEHRSQLINYLSSLDKL